MTTIFDAAEDFAHRLDERDPLAHFRERFAFPERRGAPVLYVNGNSLGLMPKAARALVGDELDDWATLAVDAHLLGKTPWLNYHEVLRDPGARLVGGHPSEVVMMNGLTVNLHLMLATFFRPVGARDKILIEDGAFPSDIYATQTQLALHGVDPAEGLIRVAPRSGETLLRTEDLVEVIERRGSEIAVVLLPGVQYYTGQFLNIAEITTAAHRSGCIAGWDLAHAAGNVPLKLHDWDVDFAVWCSYKYLNAGPGAIAGCFVHERHGHDAKIARLGGWWGNDPATRFRMREQRDFVPRSGADGWQISNPPILAMAPLRASFALFDEAGMEALRRKSVVLTGYLEWLLDRSGPKRFHVITPRSPDERGCQLSLRVLDRPAETLQAIEAGGVVCDFRPPDVVRVAPVPLYNTFHEVWRLAQVLDRASASGVVRDEP
jgi:kynureninase